MLVAMMLCAPMILFAPKAFAGLTVNVEINTDFESKTTENGAADGADLDETFFLQGGRVCFSADGKKEAESGMYAYVKGQAMLNDDASVGVDDALFEIGTATWFLKAGRFEGEGLFSKGQDIYIIGAPGAPGRYEANAARGRGDVAFALGFVPNSNMKIEVDVLYDAANSVGARPLVKFSSDTFTIRAGADFVRTTPTDNDADQETTTVGFGGDAQFNVSSLNLGASAAFRTVGGKDATGADLDDAKTLSTFGWLKMSVGGGSFGAGAGYTKLSYKDSDDEKSMMEAYLVYDRALPVEGAAAKFAVSYAKAKIEPASGSDTENSAFGARLRLWYEIPLL
jgi:hypothetical protein